MDEVGLRKYAWKFIQVRSIQPRTFQVGLCHRKFTLNECQNKPDFETNEYGPRKYLWITFVSHLIIVGSVQPQ